jgi:HTH-type transcriptional repressor of NAD biosynthesis genes
VPDTFDDESLPLNARTKIWADFIRKTFPPVDIIFSSEEYGESFAKNLNAENKIFDLQRNLFPVSASHIRQRSFQYWDFIPAIVRPYFVKKFCFYGPESTGKSVMASRMAEKYKTEFVPEVAREMITSNDFSVDDIIKIGKAQTQRITEKTKTANRILFCDTDLITTQIYSQYYLGVVPEVLHELEKKIRYELYFLFDIDVPWVSDGLRDLGSKRKEMFAIFRQELDKRKLKYILINGDWSQREDDISQIIDSYLK